VSIPNLKPNVRPQTTPPPANPSVSVVIPTLNEAMNLPWVLRRLFNYDLTYGSLAGIMITLFFFWLVGLGMVFGAELNAALAESGATALKGEVYTGPYTDELEVEEPQPGEDVEAELETGGPQL